MHTPCDVIPLHVNGLSALAGGVTLCACGCAAVPMRTNVHSFSSAVKQKRVYQISIANTTYVNNTN